MVAVTITVVKRPDTSDGSTDYDIDDATDLGILLFLPNIPGGLIQ